MGSTVMMYVLPMLLGQTYDLGKERPGFQIFNDSDLKNVVTMEQYFTDSQYRMVENSADIKDFLDISGKLSLKIKGGLVDVSGEGSYLKESSSKSNGLEILVKFHFETITKTIPTSLKPRADWSQMNKDYLGTHYCRSITYGGDLVAVIRVTASSRYDQERIKGAINGGIEAKGGSFSAEVKAKLEKLKSDAQDSSSMEINYYASVPIYGVSYDIDGLMKLVDEFPAQVKKVNNGLGNPLRMELYPLSSLEDSYPEYFENRALTELLEDLEDQFDDLRATRKVVGTWITGLPPVMPEKAQATIEDFIVKINKIYGVYMEVIAAMDLSHDASTKPLYDAMDAYKAGEYIIFQKYARQLKVLQRQIYNDYPELKPRIGGAQYTLWGRSECDSPESETVLSGVAMGSNTIQNSGSSNYLCSPEDPDLKDVKDIFPDFDPEEEEEELSHVSPIRYVGILQKFKNMNKQQIACARCRTTTRTTLLVKPGDQKCPTDKWVKEYEGILMAPGSKAPKGSYVCMDLNMQKPKGNVTFGEADISRAGEIEEVTVACGSLPCGPYAEKKPLSCVVCTI